MSAVIVTWNSEVFIENCLISLRSKLNAEQLEVIVVDNASANPSYLDTLENRYEVKVIKNKDNLGYAKAANLGLRNAQSEYFLILNPDIVFLENPLPRLIAEMEKDPAIGATAPLLLDFEGTPQISGYYSKFPTPLQYLCSNTVLTKWKWVRKLGLRFCHSSVTDTGTQILDQIPGAFLFFRNDLFEFGEWMNESFFLWMEDVDFCQRIYRKGKKVALVSEERVMHAGAGSFVKTSGSWRRKIFLESYLTYLDFYSSLSSRLITLALIASDSTYRAASLKFRMLRGGDEKGFAEAKNVELEIVKQSLLRIVKGRR